MATAKTSTVQITKSPTKSGNNTSDIQIQTQISPNAFAINPGTAKMKVNPINKLLIAEIILATFA